MTKSSRTQIEQDKKKILEELMKNAKENIDTIAKHCGFSRQKAWRMIRNLEENQFVWGYSAVVDYEKQHLQKFMLCVKRNQIHHEVNDVEEIVKNLLAPIKKDLGITMISSYRIHGEYDWVLLFTARDILQAKKFSESIMQRFPGKQSNHLNQILFTVRENYIQNPDIMRMKDFL
jgi:DNA-binding Lrp family transcriptional regulator